MRPDDRRAFFGTPATRENVRLTSARRAATASNVARSTMARSARACVMTAWDGAGRLMR